MRKVKPALHVIDLISEWTGKAVSFLIIPMVLILCYEVVLRYVFNAPTLWAHEISRHFFGLFFVLGFAYTHRHHAHVNVDILIRRLSARGQAIVNIVTSVFFFYLFGLMLWFGSTYAWRAILLQETTQSVFGSPVYPIKVAIPIGALLILLQGLAQLVRDLNTAIKGEKAELVGHLNTAIKGGEVKL